MAVHHLITSPVLRDRLNALAVFTGIALGGVSGVEMVIGGGFDTLTPGFAYQADAPRDWYDRPIEPGMGWLTQPYSVQASVTPTSMAFAPDYPVDIYGEPSDSLAGGMDDATAPAYEPRGSLRTADWAGTEPEPQTGPADEAADEMAAIEAMMAQALDDEIYNAEPAAPQSKADIIAPDYAREAFETASPS
jgi:hypothetical protein